MSHEKYENTRNKKEFMVFPFRDLSCLSWQKKEL